MVSGQEQHHRFAYSELWIAGSLVSPFVSLRGGQRLRRQCRGLAIAFQTMAV